MADQKLMAIVEDVKDAIQTNLRALNKGILEGMEQLKTYESSPASQPPSSASHLLEGAKRLAKAGTQVTILKELLDIISNLVPRALLMIRKGGYFHGWAGDGFSPEFSENTKRVRWAIEAYPELGEIIQNQEPIITNFSDLSNISNEIGEFDGFVPFKSCFFPLVVKGKVAAFLYVDSGSESELSQIDAVELQCQIAGLELTLVTAKLKKPVGNTPKPAPKVQPEEKKADGIRISPVEPEPVPEFHPEEATAAPDPEPEPESSLESPSFDDFAPQMVPETSPAPPKSSSVDDPATKKAKRVARVLVSDLKLYNEAKVAEGQKEGDLYKRIKDDIDRSYIHYKERVADLIDTTQFNYFKDEIIRQLGNGDQATIGPLPF